MALHFAATLERDADEVLGWMGPEPVDDSGALAAAMMHAHNAWDIKDYELAASEAEYAASLAREQQNTAAWWQLSNMQAEAYVLLRRMNDAEAIFRDLLAQPISNEWPELRATALGGISVIKRNAGDLEESVALARLAVDESASLPEHSVTKMKCWFILIAALSVKGDMDEAWEEAASFTALDSVPEVPSPMIGRAGWVIGNIAFRRGDVETGLAQHAIAAKHLWPQTDVHLWAHFNRASASARLIAGIADAAVEQCLANAELGFRITSSPQEQAELLLAQAHFHTLRGNFSKVLPLLKQIQEQDEELEFEAVGLMERLWAKYHVSTDDLPRARQHFLQAAKHYSDAGNSETASEILSELLEVSP